MIHHPFPDATPATPEAKAEYQHRSRGAVPFKFIPHPESGWLVSTAFGPDPLGHYKFGEVFHVSSADLPTFLQNSYQYWQERIEANLARGEKLRAAREASGGRKTRHDPLANLSLNIELEL